MNKKANDATARLTASDRAIRDKFGWSVAFDGETIVVGAPFDDGTDSEGTAMTSSGSALRLHRSPPAAVGSPPALRRSSQPLTAPKNDQFGFSVAVDGNTVVVGADQDDSNRGSAYVFTKPPNGLANDTDSADDGEFDHTTETATIAAYDRRGDDRFGKSVAVDGDTVLVGAVGDDGVKGSAYVFGTEWSDIPGSGAGTTSHIATRLPNRVEHTFRVRAVNAAGAGGVSEVDGEADGGEFPTPPVPADFTATQTGVGKVLLTWKREH